MAQTTKIDWLKARQYYLEDATRTLAEVAKEFGVSKRVTEERASREGWAELRQELGEKAYELWQKRIIDEKAKAESRHLQQYRNLQSLVNRRINSIFKSKEEPDALEVHRLARALKTAADGERVVLGLPTTVGSLTDKDGNDSISAGLAGLIKAATTVVKETGDNDADGEPNKAS